MRRNRIEEAGDGVSCWVELAGGLRARVDLGDLERVLSRRWYPHRVGGRTLAECCVPGSAYAEREGLHRFVVEAPGGKVVRAVNGDYLDCRRANLTIGPGQGGRRRGAML